MPVTYGRPRPPNNGTSSNTSSADAINPDIQPNPSSSPTELEFNQDWKQKLKDIDNDEYEGEMVRESTSSSLTPLVSSSSLTPLPESQPPRSDPPQEYRDAETDDPDTSIELNTTIDMPSSDAELVPEKEDEDSEDEPVVSKRMTKPLRVVDSDEETDSKQSPSRMSVDRPAKSSNPTTPASSAKKPVKLALSDDSDEEPADDSKQEEQEEIQAASSPQVRRSMKKGLNKSEKAEMARTQQAIAATREIRIPNATRRVDAKSFFSQYHSKVDQAEIDSYPFPPGPRSQTLPDSKVKLRDKVAALRPLSSAPVPKIQHQASSDPIVGSSQNGQAPITDEDDKPQPKGGLFGKPNALGMTMFGGGDSDDEDLPPVNQVLFATKPKPKPKQVGLEEKKRALAARKIVSDSDDDLEIAGGSQRVHSRILARAGQKLVATKKTIKQEVSESQVLRAGHANHFGRDAAPSSSPVKGGGQYEESQFGRGPLPGASSKPKSAWAGAKFTQPAARGNNNGRMSMEQLKRFVAGKAIDDGQARQKADEERWIANGGRALKKKEDGMGVEDAVRNALERAEQPQGEEEEEEDESDEEYRGSASEQEQSEEEDKENLPAAGKNRKPHEPVSDFDGSEKGEEDEDKENSLELMGVGSGLSPARIDGTSPGLGARSPAQLNGLSPGLSPRHIVPSPSRLFGRSPSHLRVSTGSGRLPLGELEDEDKAPGENAAVARAPLGELDVHEEEEEEVIRRPMKRPRKGVVEDEDEETGTPQIRSSSLSHRRLESPSQRKLGSPSQRKLPVSLSSPSQRLLNSPSQRLLSPSLRFGSPTPRAQRSRLVAGTQSFSQIKTQDMGGLGDVFGFESQAVPAGSPSGGLTQLFANSTGAGPSDGFAALRVNSDNIELTQDERSKLLYKPKISEEEARRDQELFEREDELMAQPFSPTQKEKNNQTWLNEKGLWTQTEPVQTQIVRSEGEDPSSTPLKIPTTSLGTPSPSTSPSSHTLQRIRRGAASAQESTPEPEPELASAPIPTVLERLMATQREKQKKEKRKSKLGKSEFVEGEAAESDDEYEGFGLRSKEDEGDEGDSDEDRHVEGLVDDQAMDEETEGVAQVQAKFMEQNALEDEAREKLAREVVTGKMRTRRRRGDNMDLDDDDESEDEHRRGPKNFLKKRKIDNDHLDALAKHESTRPFVNMYDKAIKSVEDDEFSHLNQITEDISIAPETNEECEEDEGEEDDEEGGEDEVKEPETPFGHAKKYIPSSERAEVSFGFKPTGFNYGDDSEDEDPATVDLPDAIPQKLAPLARGNSTNTRVQQWAAQEGSGPRVNLGRMGQGVSVTGHASKSKITKTKSTSSNRPAALAATSSAASNKLSRLGSKANGFR
ncbi:Serine/arginine repetitive matrix protein 2 [Rhizoctonia solani]|uniref:Serine/arginine repetitive matrix protein 2 n=1 Tax=Rhizoctonia solani TaxID=456999 RepID=A0A0K6GDM5_9AGAM|nr:Serine/arginine repetitive matrix protein 2 [Rhizoctonia solani]